MQVFKIILFSSIALIIGAFIIFQVYMNQSSKNIETYPYTVIKSFPDFEIRQYQKALFSSVDLPNASYEETSGKGFRILAGYIFGDNDQAQKIAMTSPVAMELKDNITMKFMIPQAYQLNNLPKPNNDQITFVEVPQKQMAALSFGGFANDQKIKEYTQKLEQLLKAQNIKHLNNFSFLGYNPPFELFNRKNEIVVEVVFE